MPIFANQYAVKSIKNEFSYAFSNVKYPGLPEFDLQEVDIDKDSTIKIKELEITPIEVMHFKLPILAYRIGDFAYITDAKTISEKEKQKLKGVKHLVVNALRKEEHFSHFSLGEALNLIEELQPEKAYLTHISHFLGKEKEISKELPKNVQLAYDGLKIRIQQ